MIKFSNVLKIFIKIYLNFILNFNKNFQQNFKCSYSLYLNKKKKNFIIYI